jgi:cation-transporting ATPase 13A1
MNDVFWFMSVPFKTNLLNTCCWLVETSQQISVIFVNYKGRPWMKGLLENQPLFLSLFICVALVAVCAWGAFPYLNQILNLEVVPEDLRIQVMGCLFVSLVGTFVWDRICVAVFAPHIFNTMIDEVKAVSFVDFIPILKTVGYVAGGTIFLISGNPILWGLGFMGWRKYKAAEQEKQQAAK